MAAYLMMRMEIVRSIPRFRSIGIYSESADTITHHMGKEVYVELYRDTRVESEYEKSLTTIEKYLVSKFCHITWVKKWYRFVYYIKDDEGNSLPTYQDIEARKAELVAQDNNALNEVLETMAGLNV